MSHALSIYDFPDAADDARALRDAVEVIAAARKKTTAAKELADPTRDGWSWQNLHKIWKEWEKSGRNPLILLDRRKHKELQRRSGEIGLPAEFLEWAGGKMLGNQRKSRPAWRAIIRQWQAWRTGDMDARIPGYDEPPCPAERGIPHGWSYRNLMDQAQPPAQELAIARIGTVAAKLYLPFIPGTREGLRYLEWVFWDDVMHDRKVVVPGYLEAVRLLQLGGLDYASGVYLKFGMRPDLPREDGTRDRLKRRDFLFLIASFLIEYGYPADYPMHFVVERATATMSLAEAQLLYDISDGLIRVGYTSMEGRFVLAWDEQKSGNPQGKGPLESWHNLFHNELACLAGQVGKDRDHSPAALQGSDREVVALSKAAMLLTPSERARIKFPYPSIAEALPETTEVVARINRRRDHELEGFGKSLMWRMRGMNMDWQPEGKLQDADPDPDLIDRLEWLPVQETPIERMQRLSEGVRMIKPHPGALVRFYEDSHTTARIERRQAKARVENKICWFGPDSPMDALPEKQEVTLHHAPIDPRYALVTSGGKFIGVWKRQQVRRGDADALAEDTRRKTSFLNHAMSAVRGKMADKLIELHRRVEANEETLTEAGVLPSEADHAHARTVQAPGSEVADALARATRAITRQPARDAERAKAFAALNADGGSDAFFDGTDGEDDPPATTTAFDAAGLL